MEFAKGDGCKREIISCFITELKRLNEERDSFAVNELSGTRLTTKISG